MYQTLRMFLCWEEHPLNYYEMFMDASEKRWQMKILLLNCWWQQNRGLPRGQEAGLCTSAGSGPKWCRFCHRIHSRICCRSQMQQGRSLPECAHTKPGGKKATNKPRQRMADLLGNHSPTVICLVRTSNIVILCRTEKAMRGKYQRILQKHPCPQIVIEESWDSKRLYDLPRVTQ